MFVVTLTLVTLVVNISAVSIGTVSEQKNMTKRGVDVGDLFPDWVPFKNKHGEELGEFVQVPKPKPKKRLALPFNFILKAVAEPEGDEYYDKGQAETGDNEDYFEKKDWSDVNRVVGQHKKPDDLLKINHTDISEIDGVVNIIKNGNKKPVKAVQDIKDSSEELIKDGNVEETITNNGNKTQEKKETKPHRYEDDVDYEDGNIEKEKPDPEEDEQSEVKKVNILDSVDELKERHAEEQKVISEKVKEEEIYQEEREREKIQAQLSQEANDKYANRYGKKSKKVTPNYDDYDEKYETVNEKYGTIVEKVETTTAKIKKKTKNVPETGKLSVFKNPQLYMIYDDDTESNTNKQTYDKATKPTTKKNNYSSRNPTDKPERYSSKYSSTTQKPDLSERISLVPEETAKQEEPALFFPKKRKNKKRKNSSKESSVEVSSKPKEILYPTIGDTTASESMAPKAVTGPSGPTADDQPTGTQSVTVTDAVSAPSDLKVREKKEENFQKEKGGGRQYSSSHEEEHTEEGKKAYEGVHKETKTAKGHHDKENHSGEYDDRGGINKHHEVESGHYGDHHHEEHGKKHAKYEELGKHSKGHSTKGSHDIHKKDEYEKKVEFFEEDGDSDEEEKHGGFNQEHGHSKGGHFKKGHYDAGHAAHTKGESGNFGKAGHVHVGKGHKSAGGHEGHGKHGQHYGNKNGKASGKKWIYYHGHPAKNANLVRIDRRADQYQHGPYYYTG